MAEQRSTEGTRDEAIDRPWQFSIKTVLFLTANAAVVLALTRLFGVIVLLIAVLLGFLCAVYWVHKRRQRSDTNLPAKKFPTLETAIVVVVYLIVIALLLPAVQVAHTPGRRSVCSANMRNIGWALHAYHDTYGSFPPAYVADENGKPMHSWRVMLLPFMEGNQIYNKYRFDEPWDGPNNKKLHSIANPALRCPSEGNPTNTDYVVVVGPNTLFPGAEARSLDDIKDVGDSISDVIMVVEIADSDIHWMEPRDLEWDQMSQGIGTMKGRSISSHHLAGANVTFADGHIKFLSDGIDPQELDAMLTVADDEEEEFENR